jgi:hypothetical protein
MRAILQCLSNEQTGQGDEPYDVTVEFVNGTRVTGLLQGTDDDGTFGILRLTDKDLYADIPRHYRIDHVVGAYYTEGS